MAHLGQALYIAADMGSRIAGHLTNKLSSLVDTKPTLSSAALFQIPARYAGRIIAFKLAQQHFKFSGSHRPSAEEIFADPKLCEHFPEICARKSKRTLAKLGFTGPQACRTAKFATHPDHGGDRTTFQSVTTACKNLKSLKI